MITIGIIQIKILLVAQVVVGNYFLKGLINHLKCQKEKISTNYNKLKVMLVIALGLLLTGYSD